MSYCAQPLAVHCSCRTNFFGFRSINVAINLYLAVLFSIINTYALIHDMGGKR